MNDPVTTTIRELSRVIRFALATEERTTRLAMLIVITAICWRIML